MSRRTLMQYLDTAAASLLKHLPALLMFGLLLVVAWQVAGWGWRFVPAPTPDARPLQAAGNVQGIVARHWFGETLAVPQARSGPDGEPPRLMATEDIRLMGVIAGGRQPAALLRVGNKTHEVLLGEGFAEGLTLKEVSTDSVLIDRQGQEIHVPLVTLPLPAAQGTDPALRAAPGSPVAPSPNFAPSRRPNPRASPP